MLLISTVLMYHPSICWFPPTATAAGTSVCTNPMYSVSFTTSNPIVLLSVLPSIPIALNVIVWCPSGRLFTSKLYVNPAFVVLYPGNAATTSALSSLVAFPLFTSSINTSILLISTVLMYQPSICWFSPAVTAAATSVCTNPIYSTWGL